jgi:hypothetical protein
MKSKHNQIKWVIHKYKIKFNICMVRQEALPVECILTTDEKLQVVIALLT